MKNIDFRIGYGAKGHVETFLVGGEYESECHAKIVIPINEVVKTLIWELRYGKGYSFGNKDLLADLYLELKEGAK